MKKSFAEKVFGVVRLIPKGETFTYKQVAAAAGHPGAFRAVGTVLKTNYDPGIPCHRVVKSDGTLGGYNRGESRKRDILITEGAKICTTQ